MPPIVANRFRCLFTKYPTAPCRLVVECSFDRETPDGKCGAVGESRFARMELACARRPKDLIDSHKAMAIENLKDFLRTTGIEFSEPEANRVMQARMDVYECPYDPDDPYGKRLRSPRARPHTPALT